MKIRVLKKIVDSTFHVVVGTEDWSENDRSLMLKYGEPEISLGGTFTHTPEAQSSSEPSSSASSGESSPSDPEEATAVYSDASDGDKEITVTIDTVYARVMTESPFVRKFDSRDMGGITAAGDIADQWKTTIETRIISKVRELRAKDSFFTTEEITEY